MAPGYKVQMPVVFSPTSYVHLTFFKMENSEEKFKCYVSYSFNDVQIHVCRCPQENCH